MPTEHLKSNVMSEYFYDPLRDPCCPRCGHSHCVSPDALWVRHHHEPCTDFTYKPEKRRFELTPDPDEEYIALDVPLLYCAECCVTFDLPTQFQVGLYLHNRAYGGPEEGGWWYDTSSLQGDVLTFTSYEEALRTMRLLNSNLKTTGVNAGRDNNSVNSEGVYQYCAFTGQAPPGTPRVVPHYE